MNLNEMRERVGGVRAIFALASVQSWCYKSVFCLLAPGPVEEELGTGAFWQHITQDKPMVSLVTLELTYPWRWRKGRTKFCSHRVSQSWTS